MDTYLPLKEYSSDISRIIYQFIGNVISIMKILIKLTINLRGSWKMGSSHNEVVDTVTRSTNS